MCTLTTLALRQEDSDSDYENDNYSEWDSSDESDTSSRKNSPDHYGTYSYPESEADSDSEVEVVGEGHHDTLLISSSGIEHRSIDMASTCLEGIVKSVIEAFDFLDGSPQTQGPRRFCAAVVISCIACWAIPHVIIDFVLL